MYALLTWRKDLIVAPHVFHGKYITITRRDDGSLRPNFKPMKMGAGFSIDSYAIGVCDELRQALTGLVEE